MVLGKEQQTAFEAAKKALQNAKLVAHFHPNKPLRVEYDASAVGLGVVLSHRVGGIDYPIKFMSQTLTKAENYSQLEKEALALVCDVTRLKDYLYGNYFNLVTEYKLLTALFSPDKTIIPMALPAFNVGHCCWEDISRA